MDHSSPGTCEPSSAAEAAPETLELITRITNLARNIQQRVWVLPLTLGLTAILATSFFSKAQSIRCWRLVGAVAKPVACTTTHAGSIAIPEVLPAHLVASFTFVGTPDFTWHPGMSPWFWISGTVLAVSVSLALVHRANRSRMLFATYLLAAIAGCLVIAVHGMLGIPMQIAHILGITLALCIASSALRSSFLAVIAGVSFLAGAVLTRHVSDLVPFLNIWIPPPSQGYIAAGIVLILGSAVLYANTRHAARKLRRLYNVDYS